MRIEVRSYEDDFLEIQSTHPRKLSILSHLFAGSGLFCSCPAAIWKWVGLAGRCVAVFKGLQIKVKAPKQVQRNSNRKEQFTAMRGSRLLSTRPLPSAEITVQLRCRIVSHRYALLSPEIRPKQQAKVETHFLQSNSQRIRNATAHLFRGALLRTCYWTGSLFLARGHRSQNHSSGKPQNNRIVLKCHSVRSRNFKL